MDFITDPQTLEDLNLLGKYKTNSIFSLFNATHTRGGEIVLEHLFRHPLTNAGAINERAQLFSYFCRHPLAFPLKKELLASVEHYLSIGTHPNRYIAFLNLARQKLLHTIAQEKEYTLVHDGIVDCIEFLNTWNDFNHSLGNDLPSAYQQIHQEVTDILEDKALAGLLRKRGTTRLSWKEVVCYDYLLKDRNFNTLKRLLEIVYQTDVYLSVAGIAREKGFHSATAVPFEKHSNYIRIKGVFHPGLPGAVGNDIEVNHTHNVIFLTGANMAGKSTFMKSFAIAVYLAHIGFPIAAKSMEFSIQDGLYTSINVADNLNMGYSHFYAEVLRVKHIATEVAKDKNLVIIFDELFKGTNVKDAYDATLAVTEAFSKYHNCCFIISTHITEAGETLQQGCHNFRFVYLPTVMQGSSPTYTYRLTEGISNDRHGMLIIRNEKILERIRGED